MAARTWSPGESLDTWFAPIEATTWKIEEETEGVEIDDASTWIV